MRRIASAIVLAVSALVVSAAVVLASHGAATPFKAAYEWPAGTYWDCSGARVENPVSVKDSETCLVTGETGFMSEGTFTGDPRGDVPWLANALWASDYDGLIAVSWAVTVTDNGDGTWTMYAVAYF